MSRRKFPISAPMLQEKALKFAKDLGNTEFKASNGWYESFRKCNNIAFYVESGEKADFDVVVEDSKEKLLTLLVGYNPCDIFNQWMRKASFSVQLRTKLCIKKSRMQ